MKSLDELASLEKFQQRLNTPPPQNELFKTPDGKAKDLPISYVEMKLDQLFYGIWETVNFATQVIANEVVGSLELRVFHPVLEQYITRTGAACIQIMVDKAPDNLQGKEKNEWALDPSNKKSNALDMAYPKLKAECIKNAAKSLGQTFGRDLNRGEKVDTFKPSIIANESTKRNAIKRSLASGNIESARKLLGMFSPLSEETRLEFENLIDNAQKSLVAA